MCLRPVAAHPATELALWRPRRELAGLTDAALDAVAACNQRTADVVRIARQVRAALAPAWYDEHDLLGAATEVVRDGAAIGPVVIHLLQELSPAAAGLRAGRGRASHRVEVNVGMVGDPDADGPVLAAHARAGIYGRSPPQP